MKLYFQYCIKFEFESRHMIFNRIIILTFWLLATNLGFSQNTLSFHVTDSLGTFPVFGAKIKVKGINKGAITDENGYAQLTDIPNGINNIEISFFGYLTKLRSFSMPENNNLMVELALVAEVSEIEEVIIEATRANRSIANIPTRIEVLTDEIDEAASMEPGKIGHLITHSTGIQVQTTSATSNGAVVRIQGLNGRYTQMLKDGFPLFGGFSGSLEILQIPPLDLKQVEYIKGSASTLYGGGAIGGLVNLLTKRAEKDETLLHLNISHIGAKDFNAFVAKKMGKFRFTNLASMHLHTAYDADKDGYTDVPEVAKFNFNPKIFFNPNNRTELYLGINAMVDNRVGGDLALVKNKELNAAHFYLDKQESNRLTSQFSARREISEYSSVTLKNSVSQYNRLIEISMDSALNRSKFGGNQLNSFSELNYNLNKSKHNFNAGLNLYTSEFKETVFDSIQKRNQHFVTYGSYINHLWDISQQISSELGFRMDYAEAISLISKSSGEYFALPRISLLYKINPSFSTRLGGGMGYRLPSIFSEEAEPFGYRGVQPIDFNSIKAERSYGGNFDLKYQSNFGKENVLLTFNQLFFFNLINNPILLTDDGTGMLSYVNGDGSLRSIGFESQLKLTIHWFTWFIGYTYTEAFLENSNELKELPLTPRHSIKGDLLFVIDGKWRCGWDYEYKSSQLLTNQLRSPTLFTTGIVVERTFENFVLFLNAENFTDVRQTRFESILSGPYNTPQFTEIYAPLDGFFFNAGIKVKI